MSSTKHRWVAATAAVVLLCGAQSFPALALADPVVVPPGPDASQESADASPAPPDLGPGPYNVTYRARVTGASRGATIAYKISDTQVNTANPTMIPGRTFEANAVLDKAQAAGMQVSIQWPYSASLHCQILVNDQIVAEADQFVAPRLTPQYDDPGYGVLSCGSVTDFAGTAAVDPIPGAPPPADPNAPPAPAPAPAAPAPAAPAPTV
jgi:hypothetical protein